MKQIDPTLNRASQKRSNGSITQKQEINQVYRQITPTQSPHVRNAEEYGYVSEVLP